jgi:hypothetical protein
MSKLIGTGINQVPSNADLGSAAFKEEKDFLSAKGSSLSAINAVIDNDPAGRVVFIYDTTLDSDNGEWRKRTHNTSWYNEELNTATRGSRREFPCVALMVLTDTGANTKLTIYDADDPDLPMWMVFRQASGYYINTNSNTLQDVAALNGKMCTVGFRMQNICFITDTLYSTEAGYYNWASPNNGISKRNQVVVTNYNNTGIRIASNTTNGIALSIRDGAPIDPATGLPKITIAVGTSSGLNIIHHDDTVTTKTASVGNNYNRVYKLAWIGKAEYLTFYFDRGYNVRNCLGVWSYKHLSSNYSSFDFNGGSTFNSVPGSLVPHIRGSGNNQGGNSTSPAMTNISTGVSKTNSSDTLIAAGKSGGLSLFNVRNLDTTETESVAHIRSNYNTGWMFSDTRLATFCDTDTGIITENSRIDPIGLSGGTGNWNAYASSGPISNVGGLLKFGPSTSAFHGCIHTINNLTPGKRYAFSAEVTTSGASPSLRIQISGIGLINGTAVTSTTNVATVIYDSFVATSATHHLEILDYGGDVGDIFYAGDIVFKEVIADRSDKLEPVNVRGKLRRTPVAPGADQVWVHGFSNDNSASIKNGKGSLNFGTANFAFMSWVQFDNTATTGFIFDRATPATGGNRMALYIEGGVLKFYTYDGSGTEAQFDVSPWNGDTAFIAVVRDGTSLHTYIDGKLVDTDTGTARNVTNTTAELVFGDRYNNPNNGQYFRGKLALTRFTGAAAGIPTTDEIQKIYEQERHMFKPNAKTTLSGPYHNVTTCDFDDSTGNLHVGTDSSYNEFSGLIRINERLTPISSSISATNGLVAED